MGVTVILGFAGVMVYVIFAVAALFPATWRMTDKQKAKINDLERYQSTYRKILIAVNVVVSLFFVVLICTIC